MLMKRPRLVAAVVLLIGLGSSTRPARADLLFDLKQVGPNVVITVSGSLSTFFDDLHNAGSTPLTPSVRAYYGEVIVGPASSSETLWQGFRGDESFGPGTFPHFPSHSTGPDMVGLYFGGDEITDGIFLPSDYQDFKMLSSTDTFDNVSLTEPGHGMGFTPGEYELVAVRDLITVRVEPVPEPPTLLGLAAAGLLGYRRPRDVALRRTGEARCRWGLDRLVSRQGAMEVQARSRACR
jgi:hypothetical protein